jgi:hypothetical protein
MQTSAAEAASLGDRGAARVELVPFPVVRHREISRQRAPIGGGRAREQQVLRLRLTIRSAHRQTALRMTGFGGWLINAEAGESVFQLGAVDEQAAAGGFYVFQFVEGAEEADFGGGVLFGVAEGAAVGGAPGGDG